MSLFMSLVGMVMLLFIAFAFSSNRKNINFRTVGGAFAIQFVLGAFILYVPWGQKLLNSFSNGVSHVINYGGDGTAFLFGSLVNFSVDGIGFIFALQVLPTLIFFSALIAVLYHIGAMQWVIRILGGTLQKILGTSRAESMSASANIFVGQTEAPLVVRPFIPKMTQSELFAVMCGGLASVAGGVLAGYASMGVPIEYLVAASFMAAPGGLLFAKILYPETDKPSENIEEAVDNEEEKPVNVIDAAAGGAASGLKLALNVGAMLIAFIGLIALVNGMLGYGAGLFGYGDSGVHDAYMVLLTSVHMDGQLASDIFLQAQAAMAEAANLPELQAGFDGTQISRDALISGLAIFDDSGVSSAVIAAKNDLITAAQVSLTLEQILGWAFSPLAFLIGVPKEEAIIAGSFIGQKLVTNEFVAYLNFMPYLGESPQIVEATGVVMSKKTTAIISFALCGFANLSSIAILLGGLGSLAPNRRPDIARMGLKAVLAGTLSNLMAATIAGFFLTLSAM